MQVEHQVTIVEHLETTYYYHVWFDSPDDCEEFKAAWTNMLEARSRLGREELKAMERCLAAMPFDGAGNVDDAAVDL